MFRIARFLAVTAVAALTLAPVLAEARPGGNSSSGSRGSRTYSAPPATNTAPTPARPMDRTMTEPGRAGAPAGATAGSPGLNAARPAAAGGNFFQRNPMLGGLLAGGLIGAMLGGGFFSGLGSLAGMLGFLLQIALIGGLVFLLVTLLRRRSQTQPAPAMAGMQRDMMPDAARIGGGGSGMPATTPVSVSAADQQQFGEALVAVNRAWSAGDTATLARITTPEMMQFFRDDYAALAARGWKNETSDLRLESGDVSEAWNEGARDYCTVAMRFSLVDVTRNLADGAVVEGHPSNRQTVTELWTFVRVQGGPWQLSAIQQTG